MVLQDNDPLLLMGSQVGFVCVAGSQSAVDRLSSLQWKTNSSKLGQDLISQVFCYSSSAFPEPQSCSCCSWFFQNPAMFYLLWLIVPEASKILLSVTDPSCTTTVPLSHLVVPFAWLCDGLAFGIISIPKENQDKIPFVFVFFFSILLGYFYFRSVP